MILLKRVAQYVCLAALAASAQTRIDLQTQGRNPMKTGTALPGTCAVGDLFVKTDNTPGQNLYLCTAADVWTLQGDAFAGVFSTVSSLPDTCSPSTDPRVVYLTSGTPGLYQCTSADTWTPADSALVPGTGLLMVCTANTCTLAIDPAWPGVTNTPPGYAATSSTSLTVGTGSRTLTTQSGLAYSPGASVVITSVSSGAWMFGVVSSYSGTTLAVNVSTTAGAGTYADWTVNLSSNPANSVPSGAPHQVLATDSSGSNVDAAALRPLVSGDLPGGYPWSSLAGVPSRFTPSPHAATHQNGGSDEIATATSSPFGIPKAGTNGKLAQGWIDFTGYQTAISGAPSAWPAIPSIGGSGLLKGSAGNAVPAGYSDVTALWSGTCSAGSFLGADGVCASPGGGGGGGTVTSVGLSLPDMFSVSGSPITGSGTLTGTLANQNANAVFAGPGNGSAAPPVFRALVPADMPSGYNAPTATALASTPVQCPPNSFATGIGANGSANCTSAAAGLSLPNTSLGTGYLSSTKTAGAGGVTANMLCKTDSAGSVVLPAAGDTGILGVCVSTATTGAATEVATRGVVSCVADNATAVNDRAIVGSTTPGACRDSGATSTAGIDISKQVIGIWLDAVTAGSLGRVDLFGPENYGSQMSQADMPALTVWENPRAGGISTNSLGLAAPNSAAVFGLIVDQTLKCNTLDFYVYTADPTSTDYYDIGIADASGNILAHCAGSGGHGINLTATGYASCPIAGAPVTITAGKRYALFTGNATVAKTEYAPYENAGYLFGGTAGSASTNGLLNPSIALPPDTWVAFQGQAIIGCHY